MSTLRLGSTGMGGSIMLFVLFLCSRGWWCCQLPVMLLASIEWVGGIELMIKGRKKVWLIEHWDRAWTGWWGAKTSLRRRVLLYWESTRNWASYETCRQPRLVLDNLAHLENDSPLRPFFSKNMCPSLSTSSRALSDPFPSFGLSFRNIIMEISRAGDGNTLDHVHGLIHGYENVSDYGHGWILLEAPCAGLDGYCGRAYYNWNMRINQIKIIGYGHGWKF